MTSSSPRAEWMWIASISSSLSARSWIIALIGVMPEPALMNSSFSGTSSGSLNSPVTSPRETIVPSRSLRTM